MRATIRTLIISALLTACYATIPGCRTPKDHFQKANLAADTIIREKRQAATGQTGAIQITRPSDLLRRNILESQGLAVSGPASLGSDKLDSLKHWPDEQYNAYVDDPNNPHITVTAEPVPLDLVTALRVSAYNSPEYQSRKERIFETALDLDLQRDAYRNTFASVLNGTFSSDQSGADPVNTDSYSGTGSISRKLKSGAILSQAIAFDLANLLTGGGSSSLGLRADSTVSIPLLRGSGEHIVTESLTQAERDVVYALQEFERHKKTFTVQVANDYLKVLQQLDDVQNSESNYRSLVLSARRSRRLADAGRLPELQVDQAMQDELRARSRWISSLASFDSRFDSFKASIGLPPDARIELDRRDLELLSRPAMTLLDELNQNDTQAEPSSGMDQTFPAADEPVELAQPDKKNAGPYEIAEEEAVRIALENRLDLRIAHGRVHDAQRKVIVRADALQARLNLGGRASFGSSDNDAKLNLENGRYAALLDLDLPLNMTAQRNEYRKSLITLEETVRSVQTLEDQIKLSIRSKLRDLLISRETLRISVQSVQLAQKRVKSSNMFLELGKAQIRDLLEAQDALLTAQNALTSAVIRYRIAELELQRDMDVLEVDDQGLWREYVPQTASATRTQTGPG